MKTSEYFGRLPCHNFRASRRTLLQAGLISFLGLGLRDVSPVMAAAGLDQIPLSTRRAKACIFLFMWGGPSQLETFDPKPTAPAEIRGEFNSIPTRVPGIHISEHFQKTAQLTDKITIIRSLTHTDPAHLSSGHATLTGQLAPVINSDADPPSPKDSPHIGSILSRLMPCGNGLPSFVALPWKALHPAAPGGEAPGQHGGWLGSAYDGMLLTGDLNNPDWKPNGLQLPADLNMERLSSRVELLKNFERRSRLARRSTSVDSFHEQQRQAVEMLASNSVQSAFDISREDEATRDRYGRNIHGQSVLMARRLVQHGVPLVSVNWHNDGQNFWDTHANNFARLKNDLIPPSDQALSALLEDLDSRGMLEETLVVWVGEFGRRPQITAANAGREHWPFCYSGIIAGGGVKQGFVYGTSDRHAAYPSADPVTPQDFATTILHLMGVPTNLVLNDRENRPHHICAGRVVEGLLA